VNRTEKKNIFYRKFLLPILGFLKQGISPEKLALALALGFVIGIVPVPWASTLICALIALVFRLNMPVIQFINQIVYPVQIALFFPFLKGGEFILETPPLNIDLDQITALVQSDLLSAFSILWEVMLLATFSWSLLCVPLFFVIYFLALPLLRKYAMKKQWDKSVG
jgi:uncharacterized protein (DUF2062 family)